VDLPGDDLAVMLVAEWPGTTRSSEVVLVGAHYDAFYSGADDNSSGVAAMLAIAAAVRGHTFARTIRFVAFDLEERGSAGSTRYVEAGFAEHVVGALVLETIGFSSSSPNSQETTTGLPLPDVGDFLLVVANQRSAPIAERMLVLGPALADLHTVAVIAPSDGNFPLTSVLNRSDNAPFWAHGVPAVMLTDTAEFRNKAYHTEDDTVDRLDPAFLAATTRTTAATLAELAELQP
jgi:Zn-dependent M28 family amino/carboxypeptidase